MESHIEKRLCKFAPITEKKKLKIRDEQLQEFLL